MIKLDHVGWFNQGQDSESFLWSPSPAAIGDSYGDDRGSKSQEALHVAHNIVPVVYDTLV